MSTLNPWQVLKEYAATNPGTASILMAAVAVAATLAAVQSFGVDLQSSIPSIVYVVGIGIVMVILGGALNNKVLVGVLQWFSVGMVIAWIGVFVCSRLYPDNLQIACVAEFWNKCATTADRVATAEAPATALAPDSAIPAVGDPSIKSGDYRVFMQFAGLLQRDDVRAAMTALKGRGWNVQGVSGGGQRTSAAAGYNEIRYTDSGDAPAAQAVADALNALKIVKKTIVPKSAPGIAKQNLEIWISL